MNDKHSQRNSGIFSKLNDILLFAGHSFVLIIEKCRGEYNFLYHI